MGLLVGPQVADWICRGETIQRDQLNQLFLTAACLIGVAFAAAWGATRGKSVRPVRKAPNLFALMRRYHPGVMMLVALAVSAIAIIFSVSTSGRVQVSASFRAAPRRRKRTLATPSQPIIAPVEADTPASATYCEAIDR